MPHQHHADPVASEFRPPRAHRACRRGCAGSAPSRGWRNYAASGWWAQHLDGVCSGHVVPSETHQCLSNDDHLITLSPRSSV
mmetsp:Transcript_3877/g.12005  ORF Transcript_3877/g.12005 Transcript_3877/m.12005 type:complete len:82 (+) Transcript_3877:3890-4135(+)